MTLKIFDKNYKLRKASLLLMVSIERVTISGSLQEVMSVGWLVRPPDSLVAL